VPKVTQTPAAVPAKDDELRRLLERAQDGDESTLPALRKYLERPAYVEAFGGDWAQLARRALISKFCGKNLILQEGVSRKLELLRAEVAGPDPSPLERLLVERVLVCWLHLHYLEITYAQQDRMSTELGAYYERSLDRAQKRYLAAIKALAVVRRLALPVLVAQVNVAQKQQVNVGAGPARQRPPEGPQPGLPPGSPEAKPAGT
jgi:hypothetical protein